MGLCTSCDAGKPTATAKVILQDGSLREYSCPLNAAYILQLHPDCFLCDSDEMEFNDVLTALHSDDELRPGQIYFALPLGFLKRHLQPHEMAALAVKASAALMKCSAGGDKCCRRRKALIVPAGEKDFKSSPRKAAIGGGGKGRSNGVPRRNKVFTANLDVIAE